MIEPTAIDFDTVDYLPSSKGLYNVYMEVYLDLEKSGIKKDNFTKGEENRKKAKVSMDDCLKDETNYF